MDRGHEEEMVIPKRVEAMITGLFPITTMITGGCNREVTRSEGFGRDGIMHLGHEESLVC